MTTAKTNSPAAPELTAELMESPELAAFLNTLHSATTVIGRTDQLLRDMETGLSTRDWDVLAFIGAFGPIRPSELLRRVVLTHSAQTLSSTINRLQDRGMVERHGHPDDSRAVLVEATADGKRVVVDVFPLIARQVIGPFTARYTATELKRLAELLSRP